MSNTGIWAVVPVKAFGQAKSRLSQAWSADQRAGLAAAMLEDVLRALAGCGALAGTCVVTDDALANRISRRFGARVMQGPREPGPSAAVAAAAKRLKDEGRVGMLAVMADLPLITSHDVSRILACGNAGADAVFVSARDGIGCNAALLTPADAMPLTFNGLGFHGHCAQAQHLGLSLRTLALSNVGLDIDVDADIAAFIQGGAIGRTADFLSTQAPGDPRRGKRVSQPTTEAAL